MPASFRIVYADGTETNFDMQACFSSLYRVSRPRTTQFFDAKFMHQPVEGDPFYSPEGQKHFVDSVLDHFDLRRYVINDQTYVRDGYLRVDTKWPNALLVLIGTITRYMYENSRVGQDTVYLESKGIPFKWAFLYSHICGRFKPYRAPENASMKWSLDYTVGNHSWLHGRTLHKMNLDQFKDVHKRVEEYIGKGMTLRNGQNQYAGMTYLIAGNGGNPYEYDTNHLWGALHQVVADSVYKRPRSFKDVHDKWIIGISEDKALQYIRAAIERLTA